MARDEVYREAEKKIEEARRWGAEGLDLGNMKLTELPESLGTLTQLQMFEDAVQVASALALGLDAIVTRNLADYAGAALPVYAPADFMGRLPAP
jgi:hypothetical protein